MNTALTLRKIAAATLTVAGLAGVTHARADITFYEDDGFRGRSWKTVDRERNFDRQGVNDMASSVIVTGSRWEVCEDAAFSGRCLVLRPGQYPSLRELGFNDMVTSARIVPQNRSVDEDRYAPAPVVQRDYRRRQGEQVFAAQVTNVRAVMGEPQQRCWVEQQQVPAEQRSGVPGGIAGAVIGGILGHQIGGGRGQDIATVGGAVGGAVVGSRIGTRNNGDVRTQDVQRCSTVGETRPAYYDVTYSFRGQQHTAQMTTPPGATINVNRAGEPRA